MASDLLHAECIKKTSLPLTGTDIVQLWTLCLKLASPKILWTTLWHEIFSSDAFEGIETLSVDLVRGSLSSSKNIAALHTLLQVEAAIWSQRSQDVGQKKITPYFSIVSHFLSLCDLFHFPPFKMLSLHHFWPSADPQWKELNDPSALWRACRWTCCCFQFVINLMLIKKWSEWHLLILTANCRPIRGL